ncbi:Endonuclease MutS2 [Castellaniella denitrificans]
MISLSLLYRDPASRPAREREEPPPFFVDLGLDLIVRRIVAGKEEYRLPPLFHRPADDAGTIGYRQEIMRDLEDPRLLDELNTFAGRFHDMRADLAQAEKLRETYQRREWFLSAVERYCQAVRGFSEGLRRHACRLAGLSALSAYLDAYAASGRFLELAEHARMARAALRDIVYEIRINGDTFTVSAYHDAEDYSASVAATFEKFKQWAGKDYRARFLDEPGMNHVEAKILEFVVRLFPDAFARLDAFCDSHRDYLDETLEIVDREAQFYVAYLDHMKRFRAKGLGFCYPRIDERKAHVFARDTYDLALAGNLLDGEAAVVRNDFSLEGKERIFIVSGPNQGGKTTFARAFGQLHYLAKLGLPVPGASARLFLYDALYTHFERAEDLRSLHGKLEDDLVRIHRILRAATPRSLVIMNEIFTSTTLQDALFLATKILEDIVRLDLLCVCVTFMHELARVSGTTVSMVSTVVPGDPSKRTYKVVRRAADGRSYAMSIAEKYGLDADALRGRLDALSARDRPGRGSAR